MRRRRGALRQRHVRGLHLAHPELGPKPLLTKLREQQPDLAAGNKEVREALVRRALELPRARRRETMGEI